MGSGCEKLEKPRVILLHSLVSPIVLPCSRSKWEAVCVAGCRFTAREAC